MDTNAVRNLIRVGRISSVNPETMTAKVTFPDKDNMISANLHVLNRGSKTCKDYYIPAIDEQVLCIFLPNAGGKGSSTGFILGSFFSVADSPVKTGEGIRRVDFGDGSYVEHDASSGNITVHAAGDLILTGANVRINE